MLVLYSKFNIITMKKFPVNYIKLPNKPSRSKC